MNKNLSNVPSAGTKEQQRTAADNSRSASVEANPMLPAAAGSLRKFVWVGFNKHFKEYWVSEPLTTRQLLEGKHPSFFNIGNDNCIFVMEIFEGDSLIYYSQSSMSGMTVKNENGVFVGEGPFNTHPLSDYFNSGDFVNMEHEC